MQVSFVFKTDSEVLLKKRIIGPPPSRVLPWIRQIHAWQWKISYIANLGIEFGRDYYAENIESIFLMFLTDSVFAVREEGINKVILLAETFKADWVINSYIPKVKKIFSNNKFGYLHRITAINSLVVLIIINSRE